MKECRPKKINIHKFLFILVIFFLIILPINSTAADQKTSIDVRSMMLTNENVPIIIILKEEAHFQSLSKENLMSGLKSRSSSSQNDIRKLLDEEKTRGKADNIKQFWIVNAIAVKASPELIRTLSMRDDIESIGLDSKMHVLENYSALVSGGQIELATSEIKRINATEVWELGIDGSGINVSVIDTGINASHPDISGRVIKWIDYINSNSSAYDDYGHGTHVAGTVGGNGSRGTTTGVAPNVNLFGAKVLNSTGDGFTNDVISAIQWSVDNKADIISLSLGGGRDTAVTTAIDNAISAGVTVIAAAGNSGSDPGTISYPAGEKNVIAVGAVDISDIIAWFSSRGPITVDGDVLIKPDVSAPGVFIISLNHLSNDYRNESGTSMATPHVSGAAALLLQAARKQGTALTPVQIKSILEDTSIDLGTAGKDNNYGAGRINVSAAVFSLDIVGPSVIANPTYYPEGFIAARNGTKITLNATITDAIKGVKNASVNASLLNASPNTVLLNNMSGFWVNNSVVVNASGGVYSLDITAYDNVSNINNTEHFTVIVDNTPPTIDSYRTIYPDVFSAAKNGTTIIMNASFSDATAGIKNATVNVSQVNNSIGDVLLANNSGFWNSSVKVNASDGIYYLNITVYDNVGNLNDTENFTVIVDNSKPNVTINPVSYQRGTAAKTGGIIEFNVSVDDPVSNSASSGPKNASVNVSLINNTGIIALINNSGFWKGNVIFDMSKDDGNYSLNVSFSDNAGNTNSSERINISIDNTPPSVEDELVSPSLINISEPINITANITSIDAVSQVNKSEINALITYPNGTSASYQMSNGSNNSYYVNFSGTGQYGGYNVTIHANDTTGNTNSTQQITFTASRISNLDVNLTGNNTGTITVAPFSNTSLHLYSNNSTNGTIRISQSKVNITSIALGITNPGIYVLINASPNIIYNMTFAVVSVNYTDADISSYVESSLRLYRWNNTSWEKLSGPGSPSFVIDAGVDTENNYVWANITKLSEFAIAGDIYQEQKNNAPSGGGGGGGGGGGKSDENYTNIEVVEKYDMEISKNALTSYRFKDPKNPIMFVNITGNISIGLITATIELLKGTSTIVKVPPDGLVYKNANIWVGTSGMATPKNIKEALIKFKVDNSWMSANGVLASDIVLVKWDGSSWIKLETKVSSKDDTNTYLEGKTNSFSPFAIIVVKSTGTSSQVTTPGGTSTPQKVEETTRSKKKGTPGFDIVLVAASISALYLLGRKRR